MPPKKDKMTKKIKQIDPEKVKQIRALASQGMSTEERAEIDKLIERVNSYDDQLEEYRKKIKDLEETNTILLKLSESYEVLLKKHQKSFKLEDFMTFLEHHDKARERCCDEFAAKAGTMMNVLQSFREADNLLVNTLNLDGVPISNKKKPVLVKFINEERTIIIRLIKELDAIYQPGPENTIKMDPEEILKNVFEQIKLSDAETKAYIKAELEKNQKAILEFEKSPNPARMDVLQKMIDFVSDPADCPPPEPKPESLKESKVEDID